MTVHGPHTHVGPDMLWPTAHTIADFNHLLERPCAEAWRRYTLIRPPPGAAGPGSAALFLSAVGRSARAPDGRLSPLDMREEISSPLLAPLVA